MKGVRPVPQALPEGFFVYLDKLISQGVQMPDWFLKAAYQPRSAAMRPMNDRNRFIDIAIASSLEAYFSAEKGDVLEVTYLHRAESLYGATHQKIAVIVTRAASLKRLQAPSLQVKPFGIWAVIEEGHYLEDEDEEDEDYLEDEDEDDDSSGSGTWIDTERGWLEWMISSGGSIDLAIPEVSDKRPHWGPKWGWGDRQSVFAMTLYAGSATRDSSGGLQYEVVDDKSPVLNIEFGAPSLYKQIVGEAETSAFVRRMMNPRNY
jgi:hypothetical protein